jgi:hypothetical protein
VLVFAGATAASADPIVISSIDWPSVAQASSSDGVCTIVADDTVPDGYTLFDDKSVLNPGTAYALTIGETDTFGAQLVPGGGYSFAPGLATTETVTCTAGSDSGGDTVIPTITDWPALTVNADGSCYYEFGGVAPGYSFADESGQAIYPGTDYPLGAGDDTTITAVLLGGYVVGDGVTTHPLSCPDITPPQPVNVTITGPVVTPATTTADGSMTVSDGTGYTVSVSPANGNGGAGTYGPGAYTVVYVADRGSTVNGQASVTYNETVASELLPPAPTPVTGSVKFDHSAACTDGSTDNVLSYDIPAGLTLTNALTGPISGGGSLVITKAMRDAGSSLTFTVGVADGYSYNGSSAVSTSIGWWVATPCGGSTPPPSGTPTPTPTPTQTPPGHHGSGSDGHSGSGDGSGSTGGGSGTTGSSSGPVNVADTGSSKGGGVASANRAQGGLPAASTDTVAASTTFPTLLVIAGGSVLALIVIGAAVFVVRRRHGLGN